MRHYNHLFAFLMVGFLGSGGFVLYLALSEPFRDPVASLMGGAFLFALGLLCLFFEGRLLARWLQDSRLDETENK